MDHCSARLLQHWTIDVAEVEKKIIFCNYSGRYQIVSDNPQQCKRHQV